MSTLSNYLIVGMACFLIGCFVGRIGSYTSGLEYGIDYAIRRTLREIYKLMDKHGLGQQYDAIIQQEYDLNPDELLRTE